MRRVVWVLVVSIMFIGLASTARADEVTAWNEFMFELAKNATPATSPLNMTRNVAIVQAAVFDAVNGINPLYQSIHVAPDAEATDGASARAAAVQAAYVILSNLYSSQSGVLNTQRANSLAAIAESPVAIAKGVDWGQHVGEEVWSFSLTDGFTAPTSGYSGGTAMGEWRSLTVPPTAGAGLQYPNMRPWVLKSQSQFRPDGPPALDSERYAIDFNETMLRTSLAVGDPDSQEAQYSKFWNTSTASQLWGSVAVALAQDRGFTLAENARLLAFMGLAMGDAAIGCWEAKYHYVFWRPFTANEFADTDPNPETVKQTGWATLFATPNHPDYPSGHSCVSGAAAQVLSRYFGATEFTVVPNMPVAGHDDPDTRSYQSFSEALDEVQNARIFSGIHFRSATEAGTRLGKAVANHVLSHALKPIKGGRKVGHISE